MALKEPRPVGLRKAIYLCGLAIIAPSRFDALEREDSLALKAQPDANPSYRVLFVRRALLSSLLLVMAAGATGFLLGVLAGQYIGQSSPSVATLQVVGATILLWATLAVRGWDVQTFSGATLTERVNQWIYRFLYCLGTSLLVMSIGWTYFI
jgi:hypothetical protein